MELFRLTGIQWPGRVDLYKRGVVKLAELSDEEAMALYKEGIPYLEPTPQGRKILFPDEKPIEVKLIKPAKSPAKKSR